MDHNNEMIGRRRIRVFTTPDIAATVNRFFRANSVLHSSVLHSESSSLITHLIINNRLINKWRSKDEVIVRDCRFPGKFERKWARKWGKMKEVGDSWLWLLCYGDKRTERKNLRTKETRNRKAVARD